MGLTEQLRAAVGEPPPPGFDVDQLIAGEQHRQRRARVLGGVVAVVAVLIVTAVSIAAVRGSTPDSDRRPVATPAPVRTDDPVVIARLDSMLDRLGGPLGVPGGTRFSFKPGRVSSAPAVGRSAGAWEYVARWNTAGGTGPAGYVEIGVAPAAGGRLTCAVLARSPGTLRSCEKSTERRIDLASGSTITADGIQFDSGLGLGAHVESLVAYRSDGTEVVVAVVVSTGQTANWTDLWAIAADPVTSVRR